MNNTQHPFSCGKPDGAVLTLHSYSPLNFSIKYAGGEAGRYLCLRSYKQFLYETVITWQHNLYLSVVSA